MRTVTLDDVYRARERIAGAVRRTPLLRATPLRAALPTPLDLYLKLENLQVTGSFKARGAVNAVRSLAPEQVRRGLVTASGGNHGLGVAYAGWQEHVPATIYLPHNTPPGKAQKLAAWGARVVVEGAVWDDANRAALDAVERAGLTYVHPFADPAVIAGQGTIALEVLEDQPDLDALVVPIGGGGLISGIALAARALRPELRVVGVEPVGAPTLHASLQAGGLVELPGITTAANTLAPRRSEDINLAIIREHVAEIVLVDDAEMRDAARWLWFDLGVAPELSGAASCAAIRSGRVRLAPGERVAAIVSGAGADGIG
jgi:threonine dehydratase